MKQPLNFSKYKQQVIWDSIKDSIDERDTFMPKTYIKQIEVKIQGELHHAKNYEEFTQLMTVIIGKYGRDGTMSVRYAINYDKLVDVVERKYSELTKVKKKK